MKTKYQITMEVEVEESTSKADLMYWLKRGLKDDTTVPTKVDIVKIGATGVTPKITGCTLDLGTKVQHFANLLHEQQLARLINKFPNYPDPKKETQVKIKPGKKYIKIDVGNSGKYMIEISTGIIYGIKAYGVIHRGHWFGTLDTTNEYDWSGYTARKIA